MRQAFAAAAWTVAATLVVGSIYSLRVLEYV